MQKYELMFIINPSLQEEERNKLIWEIKAELKSASLKIINEDVWWEKDFAYKIKGSKNGYYIVYKLESERCEFFDLVKSFNLKKDIWRHLFLKIED